MDDAVLRPAGDAVSLHTIADDQDYATSQEQEDADFAFALALEDQEAESWRERHNAADAISASGPDQNINNVPYRDDPEADEEQADHARVLPPYYDNPESPNDEEQMVTVQAPCSRTSRWHPGTYLRKATPSAKAISTRLRTIKRGPIMTSLCFLLFFSGVTWVLVVVVKNNTPSSKEIAFRDSGSSNYQLKLASLYPQFESSTDAECVRTWEKYTKSLNCHEQILTSAWDRGNEEEVKKTNLDPWAYSEWVCMKECRADLRGLETALGHDCNRRTNRFDLNNYKQVKHRYFDLDEIPEGPLQLVRSLGARWDRLCEQPDRQQIPWGTYAAQLWMRWEILDGKDAATNMENLKIFLDATRERKMIEGGKRTGSVYLGGPMKESKSYDVVESTRKVGPGPGETECGHSILSWLERMMRSFEYGAIINSATGQAFGLKEWNDMMESAIRRCEITEARHLLNRVHKTWRRFGWWCDGKPCHEDESVEGAVRALLHGMTKSDWPLPDIREQMRQKSAPKAALKALHDNSLTLPCNVWIKELDNEHFIIPSDHRVHVLCSDRCRNAIDKMQEKYGAEFAEAARTLPEGNIFETWDTILQRTNRTCAGPGYNTIVTDTTCFHGAGYAALGHAAWATSPTKPSRPDLLTAYAPALDKLTANLPYNLEKIYSDDYSRFRIHRILSETACNMCLGESLIGQNPDWKDTVDEYLDDESIDGKEYVRVAKMYWSTCTAAAGRELSREMKERIWKRTGLDRFDD